ARRVRDRLQVIRRSEVCVGSRDGGELAREQSRHGLRKRVAEVGILRAAAVARPPARVYGEAHQVGETLDLLGAGSGAAGQSSEPLQVDWFTAARSEVRVDEREVGEFVLRVVVD